MVPGHVFGQHAPPAPKIRDSGSRCPPLSPTHAPAFFASHQAGRDGSPAPIHSSDRFPSKSSLLVAGLPTSRVRCTLTCLALLMSKMTPCGLRFSLFFFAFSAFCCVSVLCGSCREAKLCCTGRDSSCVVQKAPINAIIEDLSDKPCYCDHACLKLGDCCSDFKEACGVVDCQVTPWGPWTACDADCGAGTMSRTRSIQIQPQNGGRHCPSLEQRRGCQVSNCHHHPDPAIKEIAMLLPGSLSHSRTANQTSDIRKNLRVRDPSENPQYDPQKTYCVEFEVLKASKACRKEENYKALKEGERVCVRCEAEALHENLGWRCQGHGVEGRITRWSALSAPHCHGKWLRAQAEPDRTCTARTCKNESQFIFV